MRRDRRPTVAQVRRRAERLAELKKALEEALRTGEPLRWWIAQRIPWTRLLRENGIDLLSRTALGRRRLKVKPDARPVVIASFGGAITRCELFWLGRQTEQPPPAPLFPEAP